MTRVNQSLAAQQKRHHHHLDDTHIFSLSWFSSPNFAKFEKNSITVYTLSFFFWRLMLLTKIERTNYKKQRKPKTNGTKFKKAQRKTERSLTCHHHVEAAKPIRGKWKMNREVPSLHRHANRRRNSNRSPPEHTGAGQRKGTVANNLRSIHRT